MIHRAALLVFDEKIIHDQSECDAVFFVDKKAWCVYTLDVIVSSQVLYKSILCELSSLW